MKLNLFFFRFAEWWVFIFWKKLMHWLQCVVTDLTDVPMRKSWNIVNLPDRSTFWSNIQDVLSEFSISGSDCSTRLIVMGIIYVSLIVINFVEFLPLWFLVKCTHSLSSSKNVSYFCWTSLNHLQIIAPWGIKLSKS